MWIGYNPSHSSKDKKTPLHAIDYISLESCGIMSSSYRDRDHGVGLESKRRSDRLDDALRREVASNRRKPSADRELTLWGWLT